MITIEIDFYDKKTEFIADEFLLNVPERMVFAAAESTNIEYINARPFDVSDDIRTYAIDHHPELKEKFLTYDYDFIGRHGLEETEYEN